MLMGRRISGWNAVSSMDFPMFYPDLGSRLAPGERLTTPRSRGSLRAVAAARGRRHVWPEARSRSVSSKEPDQHVTLMILPAEEHREHSDLARLGIGNKPIDRPVQRQVAQSG